MNPKEEKAYWEEFIKTYQENPCLWNTKSDDYSNESKRSIAYGLLVDKLWEIDENADTTTVDAKIVSLRATFFEEMNKKKQLKKKDQNYAPTWPYYQFLLFLIPFADKNEAPIEISSSTEPQDPPEVPAPVKDNKTTKDNVTLNASNKLPASRKRKLSSDSEFDSDDDCAIFAAQLKNRMRLVDPMQKCILQKLITDLLYQAEHKKLDPKTTIANPKRNN